LPAGNIYLTKYKGRFIMYIAIRRYKIDPDMIDDVTAHARNIVLPHLVAIPGFKAYYNFHTGDGMVVAVSVYADKSGVDESNRIAEEIVRDQMSDLMPEPPEVLEGDVLISEVVESLVTPG